VKNNAILIVLLVFLVMTLFFWFQVLRIKDLPVVKRPVPPGISGAEAESFIKLAEELLIDYREPLMNLCRRDPFFRNMPSDVPEVEEKTSDEFVLSSISYSELYALAVVNGEILAEGDAIPGCEFVIENIEADKVEISNGESKYTLEMAPGTGGVPFGGR
jgi:hypothetical protein